MESNSLSLIDKIPVSPLSIARGADSQIGLALLNRDGDFSLSVMVEEGASLSLNLLSLSRGDSDMKVEVSLKEGARFECHGAVVSEGGDKKRLSVSVYHEGASSVGDVICHGIVESGARLTLTGVSHIAKGSKKSKTNQESRIIVFDKGCFASASPVLKIDENDVEARHAATEGMLSEEHLFYLMSRGLSEKEAKGLITMGYFAPVIDRFAEEEKEKLLEETRRRLS